ncbi:hypothetical protein PAXRUDRAFT_832178 [Paxillus rubicundulus Ve08.2h10]|uniref:Uncharacterized protein n=1 Tax=Paxillus rubicundulus Ve08.2h10 TaxID=930991 RepID=A0A0D0D397_9AGAM|nr:hypothetical protein PAXRUDRAFT_832178 [Paxillus rubicundulus Ve08.2h10]
MTTPPVGSMHTTATAAAMHLSTTSLEYTEQLATDRPMEDVRHKTNSPVYAPDSNPWPHKNMCFDAAKMSKTNMFTELGDISSMHDAPEIAPNPAPPNGLTVGPRKFVRESPIFLRDISFGNHHLIEFGGYTRREDSSLAFHSDGEARGRVTDFDLD